MPPSVKAAIGLFSCAAVAVVAGAGRPSDGSRAAPPASARPAGVLASLAVASPASTHRPVPAATVDAVPGSREILSPTANVTRHVYSDLVRRIARRYAVEWELVMAIIDSESGGNPSAVSPAGAVGLMQLMPETAVALGVDPWDPEQNIEGAVRYLSTLISTFGSEDLSLIAYNAGPGFARRYKDGTVELGAETRAFLTRVGRRVR
jgi:soluble lytic murein transglycosylase-like protein